MSDILIRAGAFVAIILLGFLLKRFGLFKESDFSVLSKLLMKVTFPAAIISSFTGREVDPAMLSLAALAMGCGIVYMLLAALVNAGAPREKKAFDILNLPGYNIGNFTMPFVQSFLGPTSILATGIFDMGNAVICLGGAFGVASTVKSGAGFSVKRILSALGRSVPFLTYVIMITLNLTGVRLPATVLRFADVIKSASTFVAMLMIGVGLKLKVNKSQLGSILKIVFTRYVLAACFAAVFWFVLPFDLAVRQALVLLCFSPIGAATPAFTGQLRSDVGLSSAINSICIICSIVIMTGLLTILL